MDNHETHEPHENGDKIVFREESYLILGACYEIYKDKGNGFLEAVYQECLRREFSRQGIDFVEKPKLQITYRGEVLDQYYEPDFYCFGKIILELKAIKMITDEHRAQIMNYLKAARLRLGILANFGHYPTE